MGRIFKQFWIYGYCSRMRLRRKRVRDYSKHDYRILGIGVGQSQAVTFVAAWLF